MGNPYKSALGNDFQCISMLYFLPNREKRAQEADAPSPPDAPQMEKFVAKLEHLIDGDLVGAVSVNLGKGSTVSAAWGLWFLKLWCLGALMPWPLSPAGKAYVTQAELPLSLPNPLCRAKRCLSFCPPG